MEGQLHFQSFYCILLHHCLFNPVQVSSHMCDDSIFELILIFTPVMGPAVNPCRYKSLTFLNNVWCPTF